jgi:mono/diheme cytochrome c family protein
MRRILRTTAVAAVTLVTGACTQIDNMLASVPVFAFLREAPSFDPYEAPRPAPPNAVPFSTPAGEVEPQIALTPTGLDEFAASPYGQNPLVGDTAALALGQVMYDRYCAVCHGPQGGGDGTIMGEGRYPPLAPNLTLPATVARADGYIYGVIRVGRGLMPAYGPRTTVQERWAIVNYVRQLQRAGGAAPAAPAQADTTGAAAPPPTTTTGDR